MLRSEYLAWWRDRTRRSALPLLLATLLLLMPTLPAPADCFCEGEQPQAMAGHSHTESHVHEESERHETSTAKKTIASANVASLTTEHSHLVAGSQITASRTETACCSCSQATLTTAVVACPTPSKAHADSQPVIYVEARVSGAYRFDCLTGLFGRAGPFFRSKPKLIFLASLAGRAPPVSI